MAKGDVVLIKFPFTDLSGSKLRPSVILAESQLDVTVCFITTQMQWQEPTDLVLLPTIANGLKKQSLLRINKIATLDRVLLKGLLGTISENDLFELDKKLKVLFQL